MLYLIVQIGIWIAIAAIVFFLIGLWVGRSRACCAPSETSPPTPSENDEVKVAAAASAVSTGPSGKPLAAVTPVTVASTPVKEPLPDPIIEGNTIMNINHALMKADEGKSLKEICDLPVSSLQGVSEGDAEKLQAAFGIKTVRDLAECKFFKWASAIVALSACEE